MTPIYRMCLNIRCYRRGGSWAWCWAGIRRALKDLAVDAAHVVLLLGGIGAILFSFLIFAGGQQ